MQDINFSETCRFADLVLPAAASLEKEGTFTSTERRIQRIYKAMEPLGESKADWEIIQLIANRMGANWNYTHPSEIMDEVARLTPIFAGVNYDRLEGYKSLQWPVAADGTDSPLLFTEKFPFPDGKARFYPDRVHSALRREPSEDFDLHLNNGRLLEHFQQGSMTYRTAGIKAMTPTTFLEISPELAAERGITTGRYVQLMSPYGIVRVQVVVTDRVQGKQLYMPINSVDRARQPAHQQLHRPQHPHTRLQGDRRHHDRPPRTRRQPAAAPETSATATRTPQPGLEIERKWARADYHLPGTAPGDKLVQITSTTV